MIKYFERLLNSIDASVKSLDYDTFERLVDNAVNIQKAGQKIVVTGLGKNVSICEKFVGTMTSFGLNACFMHSNSAIHGDLGLVWDGDLVIMLTKSGSPEESIYLYEHLEKRNLTLWLITFQKDSRLAEKFPNVIALELDHEGDLWNIAPNNSTTLYLIILQALAVCVAERMEIPLARFKENHPGGAIGMRLGNE